jgi:hypothetical protein
MLSGDFFAESCGFSVALAFAVFQVSDHFHKIKTYFLIQKTLISGKIAQMNR